ncbi:MAG: ATP-binding cassette domain-containing protein [Thermoanaerobaculales bacterium]
MRLSGDARPVFRDLGLKLDPGEVVGVAGRSGTGKTTLLHTIAGLVPWLRPADVGGEVLLGGEPVDDLDPGQRAHLIATCLDRSDAQLFLPTVGQELEAARRLHGGSPFIERVAERLGVDALVHRRITELSSGQRQRVALAVTLGASPHPVLLDEPCAHLDGDAVKALEELLREAAESGGAVLLSEQAGWRLGVGIDRWLALDGGRLGSQAPPPRPDPPPPRAQPGRPFALVAKSLVLERGGRRLLDGVDLEVRAGEVVLLTGPNGAGKSTLARVLAGLWKAAAGSVTLGGRVGLMLPSAELQLFSGTVAGEVSEADPSRGEAARVLRRHRLDHLAARAPWTLSRGERQRLVHAALDLQRPALMIVDEPGQGLDPEDLLEFVDLIHRRAEKGRAYLVISHRRELATAAHRHLRIENLRLVEAP